MEAIKIFLEKNVAALLVILFLAIIIMLLIIVRLFVNHRKLKARYDMFIGTNGKRTKNEFEDLVKNYMETSKNIDAKYNRILDVVEDLDKNLKHCCQKVGIVRYNPFEEMGGNLCFAVAILDAENNGIVFNGIHSRTGTFTYAKPIELGVSTYVLSKEELEAIEKAKTTAYESVDKKILINKPAKTYKMKSRKKKNREEIYKKNKHYNFEDKEETMDRDSENS